MAYVDLATVYDGALDDTIKAILADYPDITSEVISQGDPNWRTIGTRPVVRYTGSEEALLAMCFEEYGMDTSDTLSWMESRSFALGDAVQFDGQHWIVAQCTDGFAEKHAQVQRITDPVYLEAQTGEGQWTWAARAAIAPVV